MTDDEYQTIFPLPNGERVRVRGNRKKKKEEGK